MMGKMGLLLGLILMGGAFVLLFGLLLGVEDLARHSTFGPMLTDTFCNPGEKVVSESRAYRRAGESGQEILFFCQDSQGRRRDITGAYVVVAIVGFIVPFLLGLFMVIGSVRRMVARAASQMMRIPAGGMVSLPGMPRSSNMQVTGHDVSAGSNVNDFIQQAFNASQQEIARGDDLSSRLRKLDEARDAGLISGDEYQRARQKILDAL